MLRLSEWGRAIERAMAMDEATWARHASPWSVWTRVPILPAMALAVYSRAWIGWWALLPVALLAFWTLVNPRIFPPPRSLGSWASRGVMGERIWLARSERPIPPHHARAATMLSAASLVGVAVLAYGLLVLDPWATVAGTILAAGAKLWFVDRMVWLHDETDAR
ncbi:DUF6653 family protein [Acuticoccus sediminis]|nr:DUF6653 family protein [Acuticoccus sediminis]